jgi:hypothetical protein
MHQIMNVMTHSKLTLFAESQQSQYQLGIELEDIDGRSQSRRFPRLAIKLHDRRLLVREGHFALLIETRIF